jgi:hypothetical protein
MIMFRRFTSDDLYARGEQFSEPQDGPQGHYWSGVPPPAVDLGMIGYLTIFFGYVKKKFFKGI